MQYDFNDAPYVINTLPVLNSNTHGLFYTIYSFLLKNNNKSDSEESLSVHLPTNSTSSTY